VCTIQFCSVVFGVTTAVMHTIPIHHDCV